MIPPSYAERMAELEAVIAADTDQDPDVQPPTGARLPPALARRIANIHTHQAQPSQPHQQRRTA